MPSIYWTWRTMSAIRRQVNCNLISAILYLGLITTTEPVVGNTTSQLDRKNDFMKGDPAIQSDPSLLPVDPAVQQGPRYLDVQQQPTVGFLKPGRNVPPQIDSAAASKPQPFSFSSLHAGASSDTILTNFQTDLSYNLRPR